MKIEQQNNLKKPAYATCAALLASTVLLGGCMPWIEGTPTTTSELQLEGEVAETVIETEETSAIETEETTKPAYVYQSPVEIDDPDSVPVPKEYFEEVDKKYTIDDLVREIGPYSRCESSGYYVWKLEDGTEAWVLYLNSDGYIKRILNIDGIDESLIYTSYGDADMLEWSSYNGYESCLLVPREYGPDLDTGWYLLEEDEYYYIVICSGQEADGGYFLYPYKVIYNIREDRETFTIMVDVETYADDMAETKGGGYPCCIVKLKTLPPNIIVTDILANEIQFMGMLTDSEEWGINIQVDEDYTVIFTDGGSPEARTTYLYKTIHGEYTFINAITKSDDDGQKIIVKGFGQADNIDQAVQVTQRFGSCEYALVKGDEENRITVEDYRKTLE